MKWFVVLSLVANVLATSVIPVGSGGLHARRSKRILGRRVDGICKPRPSEFPSSTSVVVSPTTSSRPQVTTTTTRSVSPSSVPVQGIAANVLPLGLGNSANSWSTVPNVSSEYHALADTGSTLRPTKVLGGSLVAVGAAPDGRAAMEVFFGKGSYALNSGVAGGISFYAYGPSDLSSGNEFTLGYSIFFESGFDFVHGGKLPGLYGGTSNDEAASCSGGRHAATCFSTRFMWRDQGAAELYVYLPSDPANTFLCDGARIPGRSICGSDYGMSLGRGSFNFKAGQWNYVAQRIKLNTPGKADGGLQVWYNGKSIWSVGGVVFRGTGMDTSRVRGLMVQSFFGGHEVSWASRKDQRLWFADFSVAQLS